jgi:hypothetical protein
VQCECPSIVTAAVSLYGSVLAKGLGGVLGVGPLKICRGLRILGFDAGSCIVMVVFVSLLLLSNFERFII